MGHLGQFINGGESENCPALNEVLGNVHISIGKKQYFNKGHNVVNNNS